MNMAFCAANCTGYRAEAITLDGRDVALMLSLFERDPRQFAVALRQLKNRFPCNRIGGQ